jgi:hypothetical protein
MMNTIKHRIYLWEFLEKFFSKIVCGYVSNAVNKLSKFIHFILCQYHLREHMQKYGYGFITTKYHETVSFNPRECLTCVQIIKKWLHMFRKHIFMTFTKYNNTNISHAF